MKEKENKKNEIAHLCAYLSLFISVTIVVLWCCNVLEFAVVSLDSFVGAIVALLAIVVTLVLGWQIFNSIELKNKIEELNILKENLDRQEKEIEKQNNMSSHLIFASLAEIEITDEKYVSAFIYLTTSLRYSMSLDSPENIDIVLGRMELSISKIQKGTPCINMKRIQDNNNGIRKSQLYNMIKSRYEKIYDEFISKVKVTDDKQ